MDYLKFYNWKGSHSASMQNLKFSKPDSIFIFKRFNQKSGDAEETKSVLFADSLDEAIGYIRHIFLYDILTDAVDDLEYLPISPDDQSQKDALSLFNFWFKAGKITDTATCKKELIAFCDAFNKDFSSRYENEYEIKVLFGANELKKFLIERYSNYEDFDKKRLCNICDNTLFAGEMLKDFLDNFF